MTDTNDAWVVPPLEDIGFAYSDGGAFRRDGLRVEIESGWLRFETERSTGREPNSECGLPPGPWKRLEQRLLADVPLVIFADTSADDLGDVLMSVVNWLTATSNGATSPEWTRPTADTVETWVPASGRTIRLGNRVKSVDLCCDQGVALRFPLFRKPPAGIKGNRGVWLHTCLLESQEIYRMVRVQESGDSVVAEVDVTGVPVAVAEPLFRAGIDCLRAAVPAMADLAGLLVNMELTLFEKVDPTVCRENAKCKTGKSRGGRRCRQKSKS